MRPLAPILALATLLGPVACRPKGKGVHPWLAAIPEAAVTSVSGEAGWVLGNRSLQQALTHSPLAEQMLDLFVQKAHIEARTETGRITIHVLDLPKVDGKAQNLKAATGAFLIHLSGFRDPKALQAAVTESFPAEGFLRVQGQDWPQFVILDLQQGGQQVHLRVVADPAGGLWLGDLAALGRLGGKSLIDRPGVTAAAQWLSPGLKLQGAIRPDPLVRDLRSQLPAEWARELPEGVDIVLWGATPVAAAAGKPETWHFEVVVGGEAKALTQITPWLQRLGAALDAVRPQGQAPVQILQEGRRAALKATVDASQLEAALGKLGLPQMDLSKVRAGKPQA